MKPSNYGWMGIGIFFVCSLSWAVGKKPETPVRYEFPKGFQWCVATSAHQIEGGNTESDWWEWEHEADRVKNGEHSGAATDHWNRLEEDVGLLSDLGVGVYRFSVEWAKIQPRPGEWNQEAIDHYRQEVSLLKAQGIRPMVTLNHFTFPNWVRKRGAWEWEGLPEAFSQFARKVYQEIAPGERDWLTINEPLVAIAGGYFLNILPPGETRGISGVIPPLLGLLKAHAAAYHALHDEAQQAGQLIRVGIAHNIKSIDPYSPLNPVDLYLANRMDRAWNWAIIDAVETGRAEYTIPFVVHIDEEIPGLKGTQDFIGVNYYTGDRIRFAGFSGVQIEHHEHTVLSDVAWDIYPEGFYRLLKRLAKRYPGRSIYVTENGIADSKDDRRPQFIRDHLAVLHRALSEGVPVEGYCHWSFLDNFEWIEGFTPRFGLYEVDYRTFERRPRSSAKLFSEITRSNAVENVGFPF